MAVAGIMFQMVTVRTRTMAAPANRLVWEGAFEDPDNPLYLGDPVVADPHVPNIRVRDLGNHDRATMLNRLLHESVPIPLARTLGVNGLEAAVDVTVEREARADSDAERMREQLPPGSWLMRLVGDVARQQFNRGQLQAGVERMPGLDMYMMTLEPSTDEPGPDTMMIAYIRELRDKWLPLVVDSLGLKPADVWVSVRVENWPVEADIGTFDDAPGRQQKTVRMVDADFLPRMLRAMRIKQQQQSTLTGSWSDEVWGSGVAGAPRMKVVIMYAPYAGAEPHNPHNADRVMVGGIAVDSTFDPVTLTAKNKQSARFRSVHTRAVNSGLCLLIALYYSPVRVYNTTASPWRQYESAYMLDCVKPMEPIARADLGTGASGYLTIMRHHMLGTNPADIRRREVYRADEVLDWVLVKAEKFCAANHIERPGRDGLPIDVMQIAANHFRIYIRVVMEDQKEIRMYAPTESRVGERHVSTIYVANHHAYAVCKPEKLLPVLQATWAGPEVPITVQTRRSVTLKTGAEVDHSDVCPVCSSVLLQRQHCNKCNEVAFTASKVRTPTQPATLTVAEAPDSVRDENAWIVAIAPFWDGTQSLLDLPTAEGLTDDAAWGSYVQMESELTAVEETHVMDEEELLALVAEESQLTEVPPIGPSEEVGYDSVQAFSPEEEEEEVEPESVPSVAPFAEPEPEPPGMVFVLRGSGLTSLHGILSRFFEGIGKPLEIRGSEEEADWHERAFAMLDQAFSRRSSGGLATHLIYAGIAPSSARTVHRQIIRDARASVVHRDMLAWEGVEITDKDYHWPATGYRITKDCAYLLPFEEIAALQKRTRDRFRCAMKYAATSQTTLARAIINHFWMQPTKTPGRAQDHPNLLRRWSRPWVGKPSHGRFCYMCASVVPTQVCTKVAKGEYGRTRRESAPFHAPEPYCHLQCPDGTFGAEEPLMICSSCGDPWPLSLIHRGGRDAPEDGFISTNTAGHVCNCRVRIKEEVGEREPEEEEEDDDSGAEEVKEVEEEEATWVFDLETAQVAEGSPTRRAQTVVAVIMKVDKNIPYTEWEYYCWIRNPTCIPCKSRDAEPVPNRRGNTYVFDPLSSLCRFMMLTPNKFRKAMIFSHNGGKFDIQFVFGWALSHATELGRLVRPRDKSKKPYYVMPKFSVPLAVGGSAGNIIAWHFSRSGGRSKTSIDFKDTAKLLPMSLRELPKTFGFEAQVKKGFFPHSWNTLARWDSDPRRIPPISELRSVTHRAGDAFELEQWYQERITQWHEDQGSTGAPWNAREECAEYCVDDCAVLGTAVVRFRKVFADMMQLVVGHPIDPTQFNTCASMSVQLAFYIRKQNGQPAVRNMQRDAHPFDTDAKISMIVRAARTMKESRGYVATSLPFAPKSIAYWHSILGRVMGSCEGTDHISYGGPLGPADKFVLYGNGEASAIFDCRVCGQQPISVRRHVGDCVVHNCRPVPTQTASLIRSSIGAFNVKYPRGERLGECCTPVLKKDPDKNFRDIKDYRVDPRDAFFGGRTENFACRFVATPENKCHIEMADVTSEYPFICAARELPTGYAVEFYGDQCSVELAERPASEGGYFGIVKCLVRAPTEGSLPIPILPQRGAANGNGESSDAVGKLVFAFYNVNDIGKNEWVGTYTTPELERAQKHGYKILEVYGVMHWEPSQREVGPLRNFVNALMKVKFESEGVFKAGAVMDDWFRAEGIPFTSRKDTWAALSDERKMDFCRYYSEVLQVMNRGIGVPSAEGLFEQQEGNPGMLRISKLLLNSCWGKVGQRPFQTETRIISNQCDLMKMALDERIEFDASNVHPVWCEEDDDTGIYIASADYREQHIRTSPTTHAAFAAFVTAWGRLRLYDGMTEIANAPSFDDPALTLEQQRDVPQKWARILYCDTDSIMYVQQDNAPPFIEKKPGLGEFADDLKGKRGLRFVSWGAKSYRLDCEGSTPYEPDLKGTKLRAKGIVMTPANEQVLSFDFCSSLVTHASQYNGRCEACIWRKRKMQREHLEQGLIESGLSGKTPEELHEAAVDKANRLVPPPPGWAGLNERMEAALAAAPEQARKNWRVTCFMCRACYTIPTTQISSSWGSEGRNVVVRSVSKVLRLTTGKRLIVPYDGRPDANIYTVPFGYPGLGNYPIASTAVPAPPRAIQAYLRGDLNFTKRVLQPIDQVEFPDSDSDSDDDTPADARNVRARR